MDFEKITININQIGSRRYVEVRLATDGGGLNTWFFDDLELAETNTERDARLVARAKQMIRQAHRNLFDAGTPAKQLSGDWTATKPRSTLASVIQNRRPKKVRRRA